MLGRSIRLLEPGLDVKRGCGLLGVEACQLEYVAWFRRFCQLRGFEDALAVSSLVVRWS